MYLIPCLSQGLLLTFSSSVPLTPSSPWLSSPSWKLASVSCLWHSARTDLQQQHLEPVLLGKSLFSQNLMSKIAKKGRCSVEVASSHSALGFPLDRLSVLGFLELSLETTDLEPVVYFYKKWFIKMPISLWWGLALRMLCVSRHISSLICDSLNELKE